MLEEKRQVTSSYVCPPNPATSSQKCKSPENPAAGLTKQKQNYEKFSDFPNKRIRNYKNTANHSRIGLYILIHEAEIRGGFRDIPKYDTKSGQALLPPLKLQKKGLVPAAPALRACATSTPSSSARQTFPSGLWPTVKDCFGLHGHSAFGSVAKEEIGVGRKSATSIGLTTDPFNSLQAGKTVDILRCAAESTDLLPPSALPRLLCSLRLCPPARRCRLR